MRSSLLLVVLLPGLALAQERWDHRGSVGLLVATGVDGRASFGEAVSDSGARPALEVGGTVSLSEKSELRVSGRLYPSANLSGAAIVGLRRSFDAERWKTFVDFGLAAYLGAPTTFGPHFGVGVQYELHPVVGVYSALGAHIGFGNGLRLAAEVIIGLQFRSYLLE